MKTRNASLEDLVISDKCTIREAMVAISANGREVVLTSNDEDRIVGLITDGDIRRGLLRGLTLDSPTNEVATTSFFAVAPSTDRAFVLDLMKARMFQHVPVLNHERRLVAVHFLKDLIGATEKPNVAVIMAGGKGLRLRPITENLPKPMVEIAGRPMLERIVLHLVGHGIRKIYLAVNYMREIIENHFGDGSAFGCCIEYLRESEPRGTGGALTLLPTRPSDPILVLNGDLVTHIDVTAMLETHASGENAATIAVGPYQVQIPFGTVVERDRKLIALEEKPAVEFLVNRGIYVLDPGVLDEVPGNGEFPITALFPILMKKGKSVGVFYFNDSWLDVGVPEELRRAQGRS
jgi:dTDP-glucose pyrophosphorylase